MEQTGRSTGIVNPFDAAYVQGLQQQAVTGASAQVDKNLLREAQTIEGHVRATRHYGACTVGTGYTITEIAPKIVEALRNRGFAAEAKNDYRGHGDVDTSFTISWASVQPQQGALQTVQRKDGFSPDFTAAAIATLAHNTFNSDVQKNLLLLKNRLDASVADHPNYIVHKIDIPPVSSKEETTILSMLNLNTTSRILNRSDRAVTFEIQLKKV